MHPLLRSLVVGLGRVGVKAGAQAADSALRDVAVWLQTGADRVEVTRAKIKKSTRRRDEDERGTDE